MWFRVSAINAGGSSVVSPTASATTLPAAPSALTAVARTPTSVLVSWVNNSVNATGFILQQSSNGGAWTTLATPAATPGENSYLDQTVLESSAYSYQICAVGAGGSSAAATSAPVTTLPSAPTNLNAFDDNDTSVTLSWTNTSLHASHYVVQRSPDGENFTTIDTASASTNNYIDTTLSANTQYWYRVYAIASAGDSDYTNIANVTTSAGAPQNITATATSSTSVSLTWDAVNGAASYNVERSTDGRNFVNVGSSTTPAYLDTAAIEDTSYTYRIDALNGFGSDDASQGVTVATTPSAQPI